MGRISMRVMLAFLLDLILQLLVASFVSYYALGDKVVDFLWSI